MIIIIKTTGGAVMFSQLLYTVKNSLRAKQYIYLLILLTQIISLLCVFVCCGLIYNAFTKYKEASFESRCIYAEFINVHDDTASDEEKFGGGMRFDEFQKGLDSIKELFENNKANILIHGRIKLGGEYLSASVFYNGIAGSEYQPYDIVATLDGYSTGDHINIDGLKYRIAAPSETSAICFPTGSNTPPSVVPCDIQIELEHQPTYKECKAITDRITMLFDPINIAEPENLKLLDVQMNNTQVALSAVMLVIASLNCGICYSYINESRRKQFAIYKICGAKSSNCFMVCIAEAAMYMAAGFALAYLVFEYLLKNILLSFYPNIEGVYNAKMYVCVLLAYAVITLAVMSFCTIKYANAPIAEERKQI